MKKNSRRQAVGERRLTTASMRQTGDGEYRSRSGEKKNDDSLTADRCGGRWKARALDDGGAPVKGGASDDGGRTGRGDDSWTER